MIFLLRNYRVPRWNITEILSKSTALVYLLRRNVTAAAAAVAVARSPDSIYRQHKVLNLTMIDEEAMLLLAGRAYTISSAIRVYEHTRSLHTQSYTQHDPRPTMERISLNMNISLGNRRRFQNPVMLVSKCIGGESGRSSFANGH